MSKSRERLVQPPGDPKTLWRATLQTGAALLQSTDPLSGFDIYVVGLHCAKGEPHMQMEAHHYCKQVNSDFLQCVLFDGNTKDANLIGIEYIISEKLFDSLPHAEKSYWHPHNYEILSGQLTAPGLPAAAEHALMRLLVNSYGKTWHCWHTGRHDGADKPADERLRADFAAAMGIDEAEQRARRSDLASLAHPQHGVDALKDRFPDGGGRPEGVRDVAETAK
jgi:hypothetical protein